jgi:hypothetical protein
MAQPEEMDLAEPLGHQEQAGLLGLLDLVALLELAALLELVEAEGLLEQADHQAHLELAVLLELEERQIGRLFLGAEQLMDLTARHL